MHLFDVTYYTASHSLQSEIELMKLHYDNCSVRFWVCKSKTSYFPMGTNWELVIDRIFVKLMDIYCERAWNGRFNRLSGQYCSLLCLN